MAISQKPTANKDKKCWYLPVFSGCVIVRRLCFRTILFLIPTILCPLASLYYLVKKYKVTVSDKPSNCYENKTTLPNGCNPEHRIVVLQRSMQRNPRNAPVYTDHPFHDGNKKSGESGKCPTTASARENVCEGELPFCE